MPDSVEILRGVANRIPHDRLLVAHDWSRHELEMFGGEALSPVFPEIVRAIGGSRSAGLGLYVGLHRLGTEDGVDELVRPTVGLTLALWWMTHPDLSMRWLHSWTVDTGDPTILGSRRKGPGRLTVLHVGGLVERLFAEGSRARTILTAQIRGAGSPQDGYQSLLAGSIFSVTHLSALAGALLYVQEHKDDARETWPLIVATSLLADLAPSAWDADSSEAEA